MHPKLFGGHIGSSVLQGDEGISFGLELQWEIYKRLYVKFQDELMEFKKKS